MKTFIALLFSIFTLQTYAAQTNEEIIADLSIISIDEDSPVYSDSANGAQFKIDLEAKEVTLNVFQSMPTCAGDMACIMVMPAPLMVTLPLISTEMNECGSLTYTAVYHGAEFDELLETLTVTDNSNFQCQSFVPVPTFAVEYETLVPGTQLKTKATFVNVPDIGLPVLPLDSY